MVELSRVQEEILLAIASQEKEIFEAEILELLNSDRPTSWRKISQQSLSKVLSRMVEKGLVEVQIKQVKESRRYYRVESLGKNSLTEAEANRRKYYPITYNL